MTHLASILTQPACQALGWALLHFVWQGTLVALATAGCNLALRNSAARVRYAVNCLSLMLLLALPVLTLAFSVSPTPARPAAGGWMGTAILISPPASPTGMQRPGLQESFAPLLPWIVAAWISGVILLSIRWFGAWAYLRRLRRSVSLPIPAEWQRALDDLRSRAAVSTPVRLCVNGVTQAPCVLGWLRPVIFMPAAAVTGLDRQALEALLAHELAHIRRHDYLANLLQTLADTLLFYHPAVWWVSKQVRIERENCCDDIAAEICGDRLVYARTLVNLEQVRGRPAAFALSAKGGSLLHRIQRLLRGANTERPSTAWPSALAGLVIIACVLASLHPTLRANPALRGNGGAAPAPAPQAEKSQDFLTGILAAGFRHLTVEELIDLRIHGVTPDFAVAVKQGFVNVTPAELIELRIHGVDPEFIRALKANGYNNVSIDDLVSLRTFGVDIAFIRHLQENGLHDLSVDELVRLKQSGI